MCCDENTQIQSKLLLHQEIVLNNMGNILNVSFLPIFALLIHGFHFSVINGIFIRMNRLDSASCCNKVIITVFRESMPSYNDCHSAYEKWKSV